MINYLKGQAIEVVRTLAGRTLLILEVSGIGYEIQIPTSLARRFTLGEGVQIFTHQLVRDDQPVLYGFSTAAERDLFRHLLTVSGVGAQMAIAAIDTLGLELLVRAVVKSDIRTLSKPAGVGKKTAERIALELKTKLSQWRHEVGITVATLGAAPSPELQEDVEVTLLALGYTKDEIEQALSALSSDLQLLKNPQAEEWIRGAITWLSR
ncbi:MAG: Holliday junction branch migration protein RuvA [Spirulinaceae cyanobacterium SM2_1_0]|nr:Holliday junction branch migration protein RuvA [Spirulinaceae cyanobacterium SM2_1_0]